MNNYMSVIKGDQISRRGFFGQLGTLLLLGASGVATVKGGLQRDTDEQGNPYKPITSETPQAIIRGREERQATGQKLIGAGVVGTVASVAALGKLCIANPMDRYDSEVGQWVDRISGS